MCHATGAYHAPYHSSLSPVVMEAGLCSSQEHSKQQMVKWWVHVGARGPPDLMMHPAERTLMT